LPLEEVLLLDAALASVVVLVKRAETASPLMRLKVDDAVMLPEAGEPAAGGVGAEAVAADAIFFCALASSCVTE